MLFRDISISNIFIGQYGSSGMGEERWTGRYSILWHCNYVWSFSLVLIVDGVAYVLARRKEGGITRT